MKKSNGLDCELFNQTDFKNVTHIPGLNQEMQISHFLSTSQFEEQFFSISLSNWCTLIRFAFPSSTRWHLLACSIPPLCLPICCPKHNVPPFYIYWLGRKPVRWDRYFSAWCRYWQEGAKNSWRLLLEVVFFVGHSVHFRHWSIHLCAKIFNFNNEQEENNFLLLTWLKFDWQSIF